MNNPEEYLEVVLSKMYFKMKDGSAQRVDFLPADLEELKTKENFDLALEHKLLINNVKCIIYNEQCRIKPA